MEKEIIQLTKEELEIAGEIIFDEKQLNFLFRKTPEKYISKRPAKGGGEWQYVSVNYIYKCLNILFGWNWDFEIISEIINDYQVVVKGKLTGKFGEKVITKTQYGRKDIAFKTEFIFDKDGKPVYYIDSYGKQKQKKQPTKEPLDLGNDLKAAASDCLKKCASMVGIAADVYSDEDFKELEILERKDPVIDAKAQETLRVMKFIDAAKTPDDLDPIFEMIDSENKILVDAYNKKKKEIEDA